MNSKMSTHDENDLKFRYYCASTSIGPKYLNLVLWVYTRDKIGVSYTFKDAIFDYYDDLDIIKDKRKTKESFYKRDFHSHERSQLEDPHSNHETFDMSLLVKLIRRLKHLTGFADHNSEAWSKGPPDSTEMLISRAKYHRNDSAHNIEFTEEESKEKLNDLESIYINLLARTWMINCVKHELVEIKTDEIKHQFAQLRYPKGYKNRKGYVAFFNFVEFDNSVLNRDGAEGDNDAIKDTFSKFDNNKYDVNIFESLTTKQTEDKFKMLQKELSVEVESLIIFVSSHGNSKYEFCTRDGVMDFKKLRSMLREYDDCCPNLKGNPKVLFATYCQGDGYEEESSDMNMLEGEYTPEEINGNKKTVQVDRNTRTIYATSEGVVAWRKKGGGNVFIQTFCKVLREHKGLELQQLVYLTNTKMEKELKFKATSSGDSAMFNSFYF